MRKIILSEFVEYLKEVFMDFGPIHPRRMFGEYGIYHKGVMFGLVVDDTLYLKADAATARLFEENGLPQFSYDNGKSVVKISYYAAPDEIFDNPEVAATWANRSFGIARQAKLSGKRISPLKANFAKRTNPPSSSKI